jgi:hypothetical protein
LDFLLLENIVGASPTDANLGSLIIKKQRKGALLYSFLKKVTTTPLSKNSDSNKH